MKTVHYAVAIAIAMAIAPVASTQAGPPGVSGGLVGEWHLDLSGSSAPDTSGYGRNGTAVGSVDSSYGWLGTSTNMQMCLACAGPGYVEIPNASNLNFGTGSFTLAAWVRMANPGSNTIKTVIENRDSGGRGYSFGIYNGQQVFLQMNDGSIYQNYNSETRPLSANRWHHIAAVVNRDTMRYTVEFYVDGFRTYEIFDPILTNIDNGTQPFYIGGHVDAAYRFSDRIDEVKVYNRALSGVEIDQLMNPGLPSFQPGYWNDGGTRQHNNNCYNYVNNKPTNTFAQPGRAAGAGTGTMSCAAVRQAAIADGLQLVDYFDVFLYSGGTKKDAAALVVAPGYDYHWYRRNSDGYWSHKPGGTAATNRDNAGNLITDPGNANRGPYTDFCGYFRVWSDNIEGSGHEQIN